MTRKRVYAQISSFSNSHMLAPFHDKFTDKYVEKLVLARIAEYKEQNSDGDNESLAFAEKESENDLPLIEVAQRTVVESINQEQLSQGVLSSIEQLGDAENELDLIADLRNIFAVTADETINPKLMMLADYLRFSHDVVDSYLDMMEQFKLDEVNLQKVSELEPEDRPKLDVLQASDFADIYAYQGFMHKWLDEHASYLNSMAKTLQFLSKRLNDSVPSSVSAGSLLERLDEMELDIKDFSKYIKNNDFLRFLHNMYTKPEFKAFSAGYIYFQTLTDSDMKLSQEFPDSDEILMNYKDILQLCVEVRGYGQSFSRQVREIPSASLGDVSFWGEQLRQERRDKMMEGKRRRVDQARKDLLLTNEKWVNDADDIYDFVPETFRNIIVQG